MATGVGQHIAALALGMDPGRLVAGPRHILEIRTEIHVGLCVGAGLAADELLGEQQAVIKPLGRLVQGIRGVSGSTILGNGRVALILDVPALCGEAIQRSTELISQ